MLQTTNPALFERADAHIKVCNDQLKASTPERVADAAVYGAAHFKAWSLMIRSPDQETMAANRDAAIADAVEQYRRMLDENYDQYVKTFETVRD